MMVAGLRATAKAVEHPPEPKIGAPVLAPTDIVALVSMSSFLSFRPRRQGYASGPANFTIMISSTYADSAARLYALR
jgi:hypothetical protein